ncbi:hypothetical protein BpHYR1_029053 [Brachionus plicatilis]|uniref:Uncharacterized protein n=1 Tax=Brachionus plicatilis TaxID=10195 RepID=A0A3M7QJM6_BRAPC|nr:hypothetical protein BpHYR1_029053 [Brachionus plicatilis]
MKMPALIIPLIHVLRLCLKNVSTSLKIRACKVKKKTKKLLSLTELFKSHKSQVKSHQRL